MAGTPAIFFVGFTVLLLAANVNAHDSYVVFGYSGVNRPERWGRMNTSFRACSNGQFQSPINIINRSQVVEDAGLTTLLRDYKEANASLVDHGFNVGVEWKEDAGVLSISGKSYTLKSMQWHTPSEHAIDGQRYAAELQLIHESSDGNMAAIAILYDYGDADPFLNQFVDSFGTLANETTCSRDEDIEIPVGKVKTRSMSRGTRKYYRYVGSLTAPPCTENVSWTVLGKVRELSKQQVSMLKSPLSTGYQNNSRPLQPLNGRTVHLYTENEDD